ncbi:cation:H+ antiporter [Paucidesulfovibrio gracilis DSM 16080]|uniref:Cation:H+ antiporter n=1 Tax=Paucidesulfovibrio gracilis DSM 16080 TaxID=1121449 RepID=A0A1T4XER6_9BACT|nr:calcium/sodium antiporter [Paucidesulfovibrio gracilis]SKA87521.1 cation:H+ antiporter [Paucidesulfovibrio gracilis DSM 16080]
MTHDIIFFMLAVVLLWFGANWIVNSASAIARTLNISELVIGLTIVAMGTSAPEFLVTGTAAFKGLEDISLSNVVGSNIFNLGFILGLMAMIKPIRTNPTLLWRDGGLLFGTTVLILSLALTGNLGRIAGFVLLGILVTYLVYLFFRGSPLVVEDDDVARKARWYDYPVLLAGFLAIALGGDFMVESASSIATSLGVSSWVIGVTIVAAGTSLPELVTCLAASLKGRNDMLLGNLIGSDFFNFAGVLGLTCVLRPLRVSEQALPGLMLLVGMVFLVLVLIRTGWRVRRWEGALLIAINLVRWGKDFIG